MRVGRRAEVSVSADSRPYTRWQPLMHMVADLLSAQQRHQLQPLRLEQLLPLLIQLVEPLLAAVVHEGPAIMCVSRLQSCAPTGGAWMPCRCRTQHALHNVWCTMHCTTCCLQMANTSPCPCIWQSEQNFWKSLERMIWRSSVSGSSL